MMDRTRTVIARTSDFLSVDRTRGKGGQCKKEAAANLPRPLFCVFYCAIPPFVPIFWYNIRT